MLALLFTAVTAGDINPLVQEILCFSYHVHYCFTFGYALCADALMSKQGVLRSLTNILTSDERK